jgi:hypothetical protein
VVSHVASSLSTLGRTRSGRRGLGELVQVGRCVVVEPERAGDRVEDLGGRMVVTALFEPRVVLGADAGEHRELVPAQAGDPAPARDGDPDVLGTHQPEDLGVLDSLAGQVVGGRY